MVSDFVNIALLDKQGWRLLNNPNSLLARTLKARYFKDGDFLNSSLGRLPSFTWQSIWAARGLLLKGLGWRIDNGQKASIWDDVWIPLMNRLQKGSSVFLFLCLSMKTLLFGGVSCQANTWSEVVTDFFYKKVGINYIQITSKFTKNYGK